VRRPASPSAPPRERKPRRLRRWPPRRRRPRLRRRPYSSVSASRLRPPWRACVTHLLRAGSCATRS
jgi:hypothetical protein